VGLGGWADCSKVGGDHLPGLQDGSHGAEVQSVGMLHAGNEFVQNLLGGEFVQNLLGGEGFEGGCCRHSDTPISQDSVRKQGNRLIPWD